MTEFDEQKKKKKKSIFHATVWSEFMLTILLVVFLFPSSQSLYAIPDSSPPYKINENDKTNNEDKDKNIHIDQSSDGENDGSLPVMAPGKGKNEGEAKDEGKWTDAPDSIDTPDTTETPEKPGKPGEGIDSGDSTDGGGPESLDPSPDPAQSGQEEVVPVPVFRGNSAAGKKVALTFDDGPYQVWTAEYIKVLEDNEVPAAFFLVGTRVEKYPEITRKIAEKGFDLGSHSYRHGRLSQAKPEVLAEDFRKTIAALSLSGEVKYFRPPYGDYNRLVTDTAQKNNLLTIGWNVDPRDWDTENSDKIVQSVLAHVKDGSVILLHEGRKSTLAALPQIITGLREKGYQIVTLEELMK